MKWTDFILATIACGSVVLLGFLVVSFVPTSFSDTPVAEREARPSVVVPTQSIAPQTVFIPKGCVE